MTGTKKSNIKVVLLLGLICFWGVTFAAKVFADQHDGIHFQSYWGEPDENIQPYQWNVVAFNGKLVYDAFGHYTRLLETNPVLASRIPTDFSRVTFSLFYDEFMTPSGEKSPYSLSWPMTGLSMQRDTLPKGYYRNRRVRFDWFKPNGDPDYQQFTSSDAVIVVPNVIKIPVYRTVIGLNESLRSNHPIHEMIWLRKRFLDLEWQVSALATNIQRNLQNNYGCSGWYQFRFYGYVTGFDLGIENDADMDRLPPGITLVPRISECNGPPKDGQLLMGCATDNGTRIAIAENVFGSEPRAEHVVTLHEIGHTKGITGHNRLPGHVMSEGTDTATLRTSVGIEESECPALSRYKEYAAREPWED